MAPGPVACFGRCSGCGRRTSVRDLVYAKLGGHGVVIGMCRTCMEAI